jgi:hypothetical protein
MHRDEQDAGYNIGRLLANVRATISQPSTTTALVAKRSSCTIHCCTEAGYLLYNNDQFHNVDNSRMQCTQHIHQ